MKDNFEIKFWKDWLEGDLLEKQKLVKKLPIIKELAGINKLPEKYREQTLATLLNSFFEDLESAVYTKIRIENKKKRPKK